MPWDYEVWPSQSLTPFMLDLIEQTWPTSPLRSLLSELELGVYFSSQWPLTKEVNVVKEVEKIDGAWRFLTLASSIQQTYQKQKCSYFGIVMTQTLFQIFGAIFMWRIWPKIQQIFKTNKTKVICANSRFEF